jgi:hypothetical protein
MLLSGMNTNPKKQRRKIMSKKILNNKERKVVTTEELHSVVLGAVYGKAGLTRAQANGDDSDSGPNGTSCWRNDDEDESSPGPRPIRFFQY